jgi:hypothetical protein
MLPSDRAATDIGFESLADVAAMLSPLYPLAVGLTPATV